MITIKWTKTICFISICEIYIYFAATRAQNLWVFFQHLHERIALGEFKELNMILKGDVDGSVEALTDSLQKLSTEEIQVNIIHKGVGAITESDVLLASASDAIVIGFNVRPMGNARSIAEKEEIDIRSYSIIYDAINDVKDAMEGMLSPEMKEEITGTAEIRETYKISSNARALVTVRTRLNAVQDQGANIRCKATGETPSRPCVE